VAVQQGNQPVGAKQPTVLTKFANGRRVLAGQRLGRGDFCDRSLEQIRRQVLRRRAMLSDSLLVDPVLPLSEQFIERATEMPDDRRGRPLAATSIVEEPLKGQPPRAMTNQEPSS
jgi:hypothetical protein